MPKTALVQGLKIFSTCPPSNRLPQAEYVQRVQEIARWSEQAGCEGILVYTDNGLLDPWIVSQIIIGATRRLAPLVAIQPAYMHPYTAAKMVASLAYLHGRRVHLNMVAGGFKNDLLALDDHTPHDERYARLVEYTAIMQALFHDVEPVSFEGEYYRVSNLRLTPPVAPGLMPGVYVSGSSDAGLAAAQQLGATAVQYPKPPSEYEPANHDTGNRGVRIGIIARGDDYDAWRVARARFPEDRKGQITHQLAMKVSDSSWHKQLSNLGKVPPSVENPYWLVPFQNYKTFCPYLVGSYERVADEISRYVDAGYRTFILDVPASAEEMEHIGEVFERAVCAFAIG
jgi:alkanesulfonate monooxygenase